MLNFFHRHEKYKIITMLNISDFNFSKQPNRKMTSLKARKPGTYGTRSSTRAKSSYTTRTLGSSSTTRVPHAMDDDEASFEKLISTPPTSFNGIASWPSHSLSRCSDACNFHAKSSSATSFLFSES